MTWDVDVDDDDNDGSILVVVGVKDKEQLLHEIYHQKVLVYVSCIRPRHLGP